MLYDGNKYVEYQNAQEPKTNETRSLKCWSQGRYMIGGIGCKRGCWQDRNGTTILTTTRTYNTNLNYRKHLNVHIVATFVAICWYRYYKLYVFMKIAVFLLRLVLPFHFVNLFLQLYKITKYFPESGDILFNSDVAYRDVNMFCACGMFDATCAYFRRKYFRKVALSVAQHNAFDSYAIRIQDVMFEILERNFAFWVWNICFMSSRNFCNALNERLQTNNVSARVIAV